MSNSSTEGKIIRILSDKEVLISLGRENGIKKGTKLEIYERGEEIKLPDDDTVLGTLDYTKAIVEVVDIFDKFCTGQSIKRTHETITSGPMSAFQNKTKELTHIDIRSLPVNMGQIKPAVIRNKSISVGDPVRVIK